jgi:hypothetical protein
VWLVGWGRPGERACGCVGTSLALEVSRRSVVEEAGLSAAALMISMMLVVNLDMTSHGPTELYFLYADAAP